MRYPFESNEAKELNVKIFETLYYGALEASCELAAEKGTYNTYEGSPVSKGVSCSIFIVILYNRRTLIFTLRSMVLFFFSPFLADLAIRHVER